MSPEQLALVRSTHDLVGPRLDRLVVEVRVVVAASHPELGPAMPFDPAGAEPGSVGTVNDLVARVSDLPSFRDRAAAAGRAHRLEGISARHYQVFFPQLGEAMAIELSTDWTDAVAASWRLLFALMTQSMLDGARRSAAGAN